MTSKSSRGSSSDREELKECEPYLALYKALELRYQAGIRLFLPRTLSYRHSSATGRLKRRVRTGDGDVKRGYWKRLRGEANSMGHRHLVVHLNGYKDETKEDTAVVVVVTSVFGMSNTIGGYRLLESYKSVLAKSSPSSIIPLQFDYVSRRGVESFIITFHVYRPEKLIDATPTQVFGTEGSISDACKECHLERMRHRSSDFFEIGLDQLPRKAHHTREEYGTLVMYGELSIHERDSGELRKGYIDLKGLSLNLEWRKSLSNPPPLLPCCQQKYNLSQRRNGLVRTAGCSNQKPRLVRGVGPESESLPMILMWNGKVEEHLREHRCPLCWMYCGSWNGLKLHLTASHDRFLWNQTSSNVLQVHIRPEQPVDESAFNIQHWDLQRVDPAAATIKMRYVHTADAFRPYADLEEDDGLSDVDVEENFKDTQDERGMRDFEDVSCEEQEVMLVWNKFVRREFPGIRTPVAITLENLKKFARENAKTFLAKKLVPNFVLLLMTLYDFGLISNDDVLIATRILYDS